METSELKSCAYPSAGRRKLCKLAFLTGHDRCAMTCIIKCGNLTGVGLMTTSYIAATDGIKMQKVGRILV
jgi:hypothetical protein